VRRYAVRAPEDLREYDWDKGLFDTSPLFWVHTPGHFCLIGFSRAFETWGL
jgi:hypothetical protein